MAPLPVLSDMSHLAPSRSSVTASIGLLAPLAIPLCLSVYVVIGWAGGAAPFWSTPDVSLSEAVIVRDIAEAVRLIRAGHDPNRSWPVRADLSDNRQSESLTPLEAAIRTRRLEVAQVLVGAGARVTGGAQAALVEYARRVDAPDIADYLLSVHQP